MQPKLTFSDTCGSCKKILDLTRALCRRVASDEYTGIEPKYERENVSTQWVWTCPRCHATNAIHKSCLEPNDKVRFDQVSPSKILDTINNEAKGRESNEDSCLIS